VYNNAKLVHFWIVCRF